jgi:hypothetical protein
VICGARRSLRSTMGLLVVIGDVRLNPSEAGT